MKGEFKVCAFCARSFEWRKKWKLCWDEVLYCSDRCRRETRNKGTQELEVEIEATLLRLLEERGRKASLFNSPVLLRWALIRSRSLS